MSELASKAIQPIVFIILAKLLDPEDFGVMSAALMVISFSQIFWEAGMSKALIQRQSNIDDAANVAFWINLALGWTIAMVLYFMAEPVARTFFKDARVILVLQVMTLQVVLGSFSAVHTALLQKEMGFKSLFWVRFATVGLPGLASIPLAWKGMGYWALVAGTLMGQLIQVIMLWHIDKWRPSRGFHGTVAKEMMAFGVWVSFSGLLAWFYIWADAFVVGKYLGSRELGLYQTGNQFSAMIFAFLFGPITPVLYSHLSNLGQDRERVQRATQTVIKAIAIVSIPVGIIISSLANPLALALFGHKWLGIEVVIGVMILMHGFSWTVGMNGEVYRAIGKPSAEAIVSGTTLVFYLGSYLYSIHYGLEVFLWARLGLALMALALHLLVAREILSLPVMAIIGYLLLITVVSAVPAYGMRYLLIEQLGDPWWQLLVGGSADFAVVGGILFLLEKNGMLRILAPHLQRVEA